MSLMLNDSKPRKRQNGKASKPQGIKKLATTVHLTVEAAQRVDLHALMTGMDRSTYIESLITQHCRRFVVSDRGGSSESSGDITGSAI